MHLVRLSNHFEHPGDSYWSTASLPYWSLPKHFHPISHYGNFTHDNCNCQTVIFYFEAPEDIFIINNEPRLAVWVATITHPLGNTTLCRESDKSICFIKLIEIDTVFKWFFSAYLIQELRLYVVHINYELYILLPLFSYYHHISSRVFSLSPF